MWYYVGMISIGRGEKIQCRALENKKPLGIGRRKTFTAETFLFPTRKDKRGRMDGYLCSLTN